MVHTHSRCAPVSVTDNYHRNLLSGDHLHHGLLGFTPKDKPYFGRFDPTPYRAGGCSITR
jgi:hypothetical protein